MHTSYVDHTLPEGLQRRNGFLGNAPPAKPPSVQPDVDTRAPDDAFYTIADKVVLEELFRDINQREGIGGGDEVQVDPQNSIRLLSGLNDPKSNLFQPDVLSTWDFDLKRTKNVGIRDLFIRSYVKWARTVVRHETDVVFLSHIILYMTTTLPSAIYLYHSFSFTHGILHAIFTIWFAGSFTLLLHNHIHNRGVLSKQYSTFDFIFPYVLEPLMGHTWDSYFYHHVKHHHVEGNGPDDLSSTIRYQRDSVVDFLKYEARFLALLWAELPLYFAKMGKYSLAVRSFMSEMASLTFMVSMAYWKFRPTLFVLIIPFCVLRLGLMIGNWGQHALVDEVDPSSDFRSSITLIDVPVSSTTWYYKKSFVH